MSVNVAIVGATGAVGQEFLTVLAERKFPMKSLRLLASARSAGKNIEFMGKAYTVETLTHDSFKDVQIAFVRDDVNATVYRAEIFVGLS